MYEVMTRRANKVHYLPPNTNFQGPALCGYEPRNHEWLGFDGFTSGVAICPKCESASDKYSLPYAMFGEA